MSRNPSSVSVIVAAFNSAATVGRAVSSAIDLPETLEVILVDDGSSDGTIEEARQAAAGSPKLKVLSFAKNRGPAAARNAALDVSSGEFVCVLDSDDYFLEGRLGRLLANAENADFVADDILIVPEEIADAFEISTKALDDAASQTPVRQLDVVSFIEGNVPVRGRPRGELGFLKPIMRRAFIERHGLRYDETLRLGEDYAFYVRSLRAGAIFRVIGPSGYVAIERGTSLSSHHAAADLTNLAEFDAKNLHDPSLSLREREAFTRHHTVTRDNANHRHALDVRKRDGLLAGAAYALSHPASLPYIVTETWIAKSRNWKASREAGAAPEPLRARYLISGKTIAI